MMKKSKPKHPRPRYDWRAVTDGLRAEPDEWFKLDEPHPQVTAWGVRHGEPRAFEPAGSFDAVVNAKGVWLRFVGEPVEPWDHRGAITGRVDTRRFDELDRG